MWVMRLMYTGEGTGTCQIECRGNRTWGKRLHEQQGAHNGKGTVSAWLSLVPPAAVEEPCKMEGSAFLASQGR